MFSLWNLLRLTSYRAGYPDFHPPRPGQEEDSMAEAYVKNGYTAKGIVQTDNFTVHEMIHDTWEKADQAVLRQLGDLMSEVASRRERAAPAIGSVQFVFVPKSTADDKVRSSTFKLPDRRTFTGPKSQAWFNDLANPDVPLNKLNKIIPHGPKGSDLLDMLESNRVPTQRAVWYVRVAGAADIVSRSSTACHIRPPFTPIFFRKSKICPELGHPLTLPNTVSTWPPL